MKRLVLLFIFPLLACGGFNPTRPSAPEPVATSPALSSPVPQTDTLIPPTAMPPNAATFPDSDAYAWELIVSGLKRPIDLQADGSGRVFIAENPGRVRIYQNGELLPNLFLDIEDRVDDAGNEMGLLGLALHPDYVQNGFFYVNYTGKAGDTFVSRFHANGDTADPNSEVILLRITQPYPDHNGGALAFGPDGYLYIAVGDGGAADDPEGYAQSLNTLLGKILRIDVDSARPYAVPADNPFGDEIYYYGLRNPWRISFDRQTADLYIADVGQREWEEVDFVPAGSPGGWNFGWDLYEGNHDHEPRATADGEIVGPVVEYSHAEGGCSIIGGYVYRGSMPEWNGIYLYGDYCTGFVWGLMNVDGQWQARKLFEAGVQITSFGQDEVGEVYLLSDGGNVYKLVRK